MSLLLLAVVLPVSVYVVVSTPWAQEQLRTIASNELSKVLGTEVSIGKIIYHPFNTIQLESVAVNDDNGRTALSVAKVATRFELWHFIRSRKFIFDYALIDGLDAQIYRASKSSPLSIDGCVHLDFKNYNHTFSHDQDVGAVCSGKACLVWEGIPSRKSLSLIPRKTLDKRDHSL